VIGADGYRSIVRGSVAPEHPDATFAGYVIWLGVLDESAVPAARNTHGGAFLGGADEYLFGYQLPGSDGGSMVPGSRQIGWAWYDGSRNDLLHDTGSVVGNVVQHSLTSADIPAATYGQLADEARARWPSPWSDAISACAARRSITGTPIAEYVPDKLVNGRLALVGDAAHVQTPMTGQGFSSALEDAEALAEFIAAGLRRSAVTKTLPDYERKRLASVRSMVRSGQQFSRSFAGRAA
jgi:2-polyprenyl-6-methoxyphenol hydroxylase-like FAD-dependent oxidoreductase